MKNFFETFLKGVGVVVLIVIIVAATVVGTMYKFQIYQKKHGTQMTFLDYMCDSERK